MTYITKLMNKRSHRHFGCCVHVGGRRGPSSPWPPIDPLLCSSLLFSRSNVALWLISPGPIQQPSTSHYHAEMQEVAIVALVIGDQIQFSYYGIRKPIAQTITDARHSDCTQSSGPSAACII